MNPATLERLRRALLELCSEQGYAALELEAVLGRAEVGREEFDRRFADLEDLFCWVYAEAQEEAIARMSAATAGIPRWRDRLRAGAYTLLAFLAEDPLRTHLVVIDRLVAGERVQRLSEEVFTYLFDLVDQAREDAEVKGQEKLTRATAEAVGGAIFMQMYIAFERDSIEAVRDKLPEMMYMAVLPYLGPEAAADELRRPPPPLPEAPKHAGERI